MNKRVAILLLGTFAVLLAGCGKENLKLEHIHGLGYTSDGKTLLIPAHTGLVTFSNDKWSDAEAQKHDYMGFVTVDSGFYSSGHPGSGTELENPLGIIKSEDMGKTIATRGLAGESDFHLMAAGYRTHTIYVFNPTPNSKMDAMGLYFSNDDASTWKRSQMTGITSEPLALATHPIDNKVVAIGTEQGLFISQNTGDDFQQLLAGKVISALGYGVKGELFAAAANERIIYQIQQNGNIVKEIAIKEVDQGDMVSFISQNPADPSELSIATIRRNIFISRDNGESWTKIANKGITT